MSVAAPSSRPATARWNEGQIQVLRALHYARRASRRELATLSGLSPQSLTRITQELIAGGFVEELERRRTGGLGQPAIELGIVPRRILTLGLVMEYDRITCVLSDLTGGIFHRERVRGNFVTAERTVAVAERLVAKVIEQAPAGTTLLGLGVSQSGFFFDPGRQRIVALGDVEGWVSIDLGARLSEAFSLEVVIENDGRAAAAGHLVHGVGARFSDFFVVLMTQGLGGGGVSGGRLIRGRSGNAGEMPRGEGMRANVGSLAEHLDLSYADEGFESSIEAALETSDPLIMEWLTVSAAKLEKVLANVCLVLDPEAVIFSGRLPRSVREALAARIMLPAKSIDGVSAPAPEIVIDPEVDCLEVGAASLPIARVFSGARRAGAVA